jgi:hypothetical protein
MFEAKYVITKDGHAIVFSAAISHDTFKAKEPVSAGFVFFGADSDSTTCTCYGDSFSLGIGSNPEEDQRRIENQILNH